MSNSINWRDNGVFGGINKQEFINNSYDEKDLNSNEINTTSELNEFTVASPMFDEQGPPPADDINYIPGYLRSNIGRNVRAEFIIGSSQYADKTGVLIAVGVNYFVLDDVNSRTHVMCDLYSVKFVTIIMG